MCSNSKASRTGVNLRRRVGIRRCRRGPQCRRRAAAAGAQRLALSHEQQQLRYTVLRERADAGLPVAYCNLVGGQDELVFDGGSFALDKDGTLAGRAACLSKAPSARGGLWQERGLPAARPVEADVYEGAGTGRARLSEGERFPGALIDTSGGVDSACAGGATVNRWAPTGWAMIFAPTRRRWALDDSREMVRRIDCAGAAL